MQVSSPLNSAPSTYKAFLSSWKTHLRLQWSTFHNWKGRKISCDLKRYIAAPFPASGSQHYGLSSLALFVSGKWGTNLTWAARSCKQMWARQLPLLLSLPHPLPSWAWSPLFSIRALFFLNIISPVSGDIA